jgi:hypothetical protein
MIVVSRVVWGGRVGFIAAAALGKRGPLSQINWKIEKAGVASTDQY